jgi:hypothetical protein
MIRRFLEAGEKKLQMLHQVIFDCHALPKNVKWNILHFQGYDTDDYEGRTNGAGTSTRYGRR